MRASRLLSILTTLQARGHVTATALAAACEVSLRTIYRDIDALSAAGIPVYSERGSAGGYRLLDGYRTQLNGLSAKEAEALFMTGLPGPAADLGLGAVLVAAQNKLLSAMPARLRGGAEQMRARFHLDAPAWFAQAEQPAHLPLIARAVWDQHPIRIRYRSWKGERQRRVEPLGLVLKSGAWYLVGQVDGGARTYRIARILDIAVLEERFERPADFDLETHWREGAQRLEEDLHRNLATVRLSPWGLRMLQPFTSPFVYAATRIEDEADEAGWRIATLPVGSVRQACTDLLRFGAEIEVLDPPELRAKIAEVAAGMAGLYAGRNSFPYTDEECSTPASPNPREAAQ
ncbi:MAG TPA: YafY family protein [Caulobacteraceae bacterium]|jgi:predicted DNA-binding transcriptional regulator YafY